MQLARLWPCTSIGKDSISCSISWHPLAAQKELRLFGPVQQADSAAISKLTLALQWVETRSEESVAPPKLDDEFERGRRRGPSPRKVLSPAMRAQARAPPRGRAPATPSAPPVESGQGPECYLRQGNPGAPWCLVSRSSSVVPCSRLVGGLALDYSSAGTCDTLPRIAQCRSPTGKLARQALTVPLAWMGAPRRLIDIHATTRGTLCDPCPRHGGWPRQ